MSKGKVKPVQVQYDTDDWVAAMYDEKWYIGKVLHSDKDDVHIDFMKSSENFPALFEWPSVSDKIWVSRDQRQGTLPHYTSEALGVIKTPV